MPSPTLIRDEESAFRILSKSAPPLILRGMVISSLQFFGKRAIYAQADESMLAAFGIYSAIEGLIFLLIFRGLRIVSAKTAHLHAKENADPHFDPTTLGILYRQGVLFGCLLMIPTALLCISAPFIFRLTGQSKYIIQNSSGFFIFGFLSYFFDMLYRSRARVDVGRSQTMYLLIGDICQSIFDAVGTYLLIKRLGVIGGAVAYFIAAGLTAIFYNLHSYCNPNLKKYQFYQFSLSEYKNTFFSDEFKEMVHGGLYIAAKFSIVNLTLMLTTFLCGLKGIGAQVGLQAAIAYSYVVILTITGLSEAFGVVVGRFLKKNWPEARRVGNFAMIVSFLFACACASTLFILINPIARLFLKSGEAHPDDFNTVKNFLRIQAIMEIVNSVGNPGASMLAGCLETRTPFLLSLFFIFMLNSTLTGIAHFIFKSDAISMYAIQLTGLILTSIGVLKRWIKQDEIQRTAEKNMNVVPIVICPSTSLWQMQVESPCHISINESLPKEEHYALSL